MLNLQTSRTCEGSKMSKTSRGGKGTDILYLGTVEVQTLVLDSLVIFRQ